MSTGARFSSLAAVAGLALMTLAGPAAAAGIEYVYFATNPFEQRNDGPFGPAGILASLDDSVLGTLVYDPAGAYLGPSPVIPSADVYAAATDFGGLWTRETGIKIFADASAGVIVNNDSFPQPGPVPAVGDAVIVLADLALLPTNLAGFSVSDGATTFQLVNASLRWLEAGQDFLFDQSLPGLLPPPGAGPTRLLLEFAAIGDPTTTHRIVFTNVELVPVPLPAGGLLLLGGLGTLAALRRRGRRDVVAG